MIEVIINLLIFIVCALTLSKLYFVLTCARCKCRTDMTGKTVVITGANRGIGKETARLLALRNARVIIGCRQIESAKLVVHELTEGKSNGLDIIAKQLDLASFESIRKFAEEVIRYESNISVLVCNAATIPGKGSKSCKLSI